MSGTATLTDDRLLDRGIRLHERGRVRELPRRREFEVSGCDGIFKVTIERSRGGEIVHCSCDRVPCDHVIAVKLKLNEEARP